MVPIAVKLSHFQLLRSFSIDRAHSVSYHLPPQTFTYMTVTKRSGNSRIPTKPPPPPPPIYENINKRAPAPPPPHSDLTSAFARYSGRHMILFFISNFLYIVYYTIYLYYLDECWMVENMKDFPIYFFENFFFCLKNN